jgi:hypothetical protein
MWPQFHFRKKVKCQEWDRNIEVMMVFNATFKNISVISWSSVLLAEETSTQRKPRACTDLLQVTDKLLSHNVVLITLPCVICVYHHMSSPPVFSGVRVTPSLVLYVCFVDRCLSFCTFSFGHCVVYFFDIRILIAKHWLKSSLDIMTDDNKIGSIII